MISIVSSSGRHDREGIFFFSLWLALTLSALFRDLLYSIGWCHWYWSVLGNCQRL